MPTINKPPIGLTDEEILAVIACLQSLGGKPRSPWRPRSAARRRGRGRGAEAMELNRSRSCTAGRRSVVVAVLRRAAPAPRAHARLDARLWVGIYVVLRFGFATPIPASVSQHLHGDRHARARRLRHLERRAARGFSAPLVALAGEPRYAPAARASSCCSRRCRGATSVSAAERAARGRRSSGARSTRRRPTRSRSTTRRSTSCTADNPLRALETSDPEAFRDHVENGRRDLLPELLLLPRRRARRRRHVRPRPEPDPDQLHRPGRAREAPGDVLLLAHRQGRARACPTRAGRGTRRCRRGRSS